MTGASSNRWILLQNFSNSVERSKRRGRHGVGDGIVGACPGAFRPHEVVLPVLQDHEGSLDVILGRNLLEDRPIGEGNEAREVVLQLGNVAVAPASINDVIRPVTVLEYERINRLRPVVKLVNEGLSQIIRERAFRS